MQLSTFTTLISYNKIQVEIHKTVVEWEVHRNTPKIRLYLIHSLNNSCLFVCLQIDIDCVIHTQTFITKLFEQAMLIEQSMPRGFMQLMICFLM
jgi:hypothetical protein